MIFTTARCWYKVDTQMLNKYLLNKYVNMGKREKIVFVVFSKRKDRM